MRFTDVFLRRPVLAIVVSVLIVVAGLQAVRYLNVRQYPRIESATVTVTHRLRRRQRRSGARLHHHAARARDRGGRRHRLHRVAEHPGPVDDQRPPQAQLQRLGRAGRHQRPRRSGARRSAARGAGARDPDRAVGRPGRGHVSQLRLRRPAGQPGHRLPDSRRAAAAVRDRRRAARGHPGGADVRAARLAEAGSHGGAQRQPVAASPGAVRQQLPVRGRPDKGGAGPAERHRDDRRAFASKGSRSW